LAHSPASPSLPPALSAQDIRLFQRGKLRRAWRKFGAHYDAAHEGVQFACWAPHAGSVSVVGDFNDWDGRRNGLRRTGTAGVWQGFVGAIGPGAQYKFEIKNRANGRLVVKTDPYARRFPAPSNTNAEVVAPSRFRWSDADWLSYRSTADYRTTPMSIYEVHAGSWRRSAQGTALDYAALGEQLAHHVAEIGCTHVELMPIYEHPLDESLGYQITGFYAPTSRFGTPDGLRALVDRLHNAHIGVILDWVPFHFPKDEWALAEFDGAPLYERDERQMAEHPTWQTRIFNYGRPEVRNFLMSNAVYWLEEFHIDGLRVDAVSSMIYLDDARSQEWRPNPLGGREDLTAIQFLRELNAEVSAVAPEAVTIAEESTAFPDVCGPQQRGGLGFAMKWDMGWVNDTLRFMRLPWRERSQHHHDLTFGRLYAEKERFVLSFSHDEVGVTRGSLYQQLHGDEQQKLAGLRALWCYQFTYPGKKLNFMGNEFGQPFAWDGQPLTWDAAQTAAHRKLLATFTALNELYREHPALRGSDFVPGSFQWIDPEDAANSTISYLRREGDAFVVVVLNFSPQLLHDHVVAVPRRGFYETIFDSDAPLFGGRAQSVLVSPHAVERPQGAFTHALTLTLAPLSGMILEPQEPVAAMVA